LFQVVGQQLSVAATRRNPRDVEVTGDLPMSLTAFVGRERELDELQSLFRDGKRLVPLVVIHGT
jgi:hypothetical protein